MPIQFEILVLMLMAYTLGLGAGWMAWGRSAPLEEESET